MKTKTLNKIMYTCLLAMSGTSSLQSDPIKVPDIKKVLLKQQEPWFFPTWDEQAAFLEELRLFCDNATLEELQCIESFFAHSLTGIEKPLRMLRTSLSTRNLHNSMGKPKELPRSSTSELLLPMPTPVEPEPETFSIAEPMVELMDITPEIKHLREQFQDIPLDVAYAITKVLSKEDALKLSTPSRNIPPTIAELHLSYPRFSATVIYALGNISYTKPLGMLNPGVWYTDTALKLGEIMKLLFPLVKVPLSSELLSRRFIFPTGTNLDRLIHEPHSLSQYLKTTARTPDLAGFIGKICKIFSDRRAVLTCPGFILPKNSDPRMAFSVNDPLILSENFSDIIKLRRYQQRGNSTFLTLDVVEHSSITPDLLEALYAFLSEKINPATNPYQEQLMGSFFALKESFKYDVPRIIGTMKVEFPKILRLGTNPENDFGLKLNYFCFLANLFCPLLDSQVTSNDLRLLNKELIDQFALVHDAYIRDNTFLLKNVSILGTILKVYFNRLEKILDL